MTMTTTNQAIAFAPQSGNSPGDDNTSKLVAVTDAKYRWLPTNAIELSIVQDQKVLPMEMAGALLPRSAYKGGAYAAGAVEFIPRLAGSHLHWLLYSMGSSYNHVQDSTNTDIHDHYYGAGDKPIAPFDPTSEATKAASGGGPNDTDLFLSVKRLFPKPDANSSIATRSGETYEDVRVSQFTLNFVPSGPVTATVNLVGRKGSFVADTSAGENTYWNPAYKDLSSGFPGLPDNESFAIGCRGELNMPVGSSLNISAIGATVDIANGLTRPQDEMIMFSYHPETFRTLARNVTVTLNIKRNVLAMFQNIYYNGGSEWSPVVWQNGMPFSIVARTASDTIFGSAGSEFAGEIEFWAQDIIWSMQPIRSRAGQILGAQIIGTVLEPENGSTAWYVRVRNGRSPDVDEAGNTSTGFYNWPV